MAKKKSALEKFQAAKSSNKLDILHVLFRPGLVLAGIGVVFSAYQAVQEFRYQSRVSSLAEESQQAASQILLLLEDEQRRIGELAKRSEVVDAFRSGNAGELGRVEQQLSQELGGALRVKLVSTEIELLDAVPFPGLDFGALAVLIQAKESGLVAGPGVGGVSGQAHFNWAAAVTREVQGQGQLLLGLLLVTYPTDAAVRIAMDIASGSDYADLRAVPRNRAEYALASVGKLTERSMEMLPTSEIGDTRLAVGYSSYRPFMADMGIASSIALLIASLALGAAAFMARNARAIMERLAQSKQPEAVDGPVLSELTNSDLQEADDELRSAMAGAEKAVTGEAKVSGEVASVDQSMFRAYDIRGIVGKSLTVQAANSIGKAVGSEAIDRGLDQIVVARDGRTSGPELSASLIEGLVSTGVNVIDIGAVPTGMLYFATHSLNTGSGVMVTGSHNPPDYNGFKIMLGGETLAAEAIQDLYKRISEKRLHQGQGGVQEVDIIEDYVDEIASDIQLEEPLKVVVDCGNGITGMIAPQVLEEIGCEVIPLYAEVDGNFPNHHPDPSVPDNLKDLILSVKQMGADLGVAFDGDGDRLGVVTRAGEIIYPDCLLMLFAEDVLSRNPGATIIYDVKCTGHLAKSILRHGGSPLMWKTGHSFIKGKMKEANAALAGEMSGHFFFKERWYGFDDGVYSAARLLEILAASGDVDSVFEELPSSVSTPEIKVEMNEGEHYRFIEQFEREATFESARLTTIDGVRADYDDGWGLVRCSNTTPCLVMRFDAESEQALKRIQGVFKEQLLALRPDLNLPF